MPYLSKNRIFVVLATLLLAMIPVVASAQEFPENCALKDRTEPGNINSPCPHEEVEISIDSLDLEIVCELAESHEKRSYSFCEARLVFSLSATPDWPDNIVQSSTIVWRTADKSSFWGVRENWTLGESNKQYKVLGRKTLDQHFRGEQITLSDEIYYNRYSEFHEEYYRYTIRMSYYMMYEGERYSFTRHSNTVQAPVSQMKYAQDEFDLRMGKLVLDYEKQQEISRRHEQEEKTRRAEELKERKSENDLAIAKEIETISARIDALRLRIAKQIDVNVVELNLVRERTTKAAIEIDREITAIEIDTKRKYMQSLEDTARWVNEWVLEKQDQWDELAELQAQWKQRISEYQTEAAQVIQDLEAKRAEIESSIAESERRQRELEAQIRDSQIDTSQLEAQLEAAQAELKAAQERLEALEE